MRIADYITDLRKKSNVTITVANNEVKVKGLKENLTREILDEITTRKNEILDFFQLLDGENKFNISRAKIKDSYRLSSPQKRLYFLYECDKFSTAYNELQVVKITGTLDKTQVDKAFRKIFHRHESLRTFFEMSNEGPVQKISSNSDFKIDHVRISTEKVDQFIEEFSKPFDLSKAPLIRVALLELTRDEHILVLDMHHIIADGTSQGILIKDFVMAYNNLILAELPLQYKDFAEWQHEEYPQEYMVHQKNFWVNEFSEIPDVLELPTDFARPLQKSTDGNALGFELGIIETTKLKAIAESEKSTMFMVILTLFNILLSKLSNREDIVVGTPVAGRLHADFENIIGMFINTLPLRNSARGSLSFSQFLSDVKTKTLACFNNQNYPYEELIDELGITRDPSRNPLFDIMFVFENIEKAEFVIPGLDLRSYDHRRVLSKFDLTLIVKEREDRISLSFQYSTKLFQKETIERFESYFKSIVSEVLGNKEVIISDIEIISPAERYQLLYDFNQTAIGAERTETILSLFDRQVMKTPKNIALIWGSERISYEELNDRANAVASAIDARITSRIGDKIALLFTPGVEMIACILGVLKSGCAYVPLSFDAPLERNKYILLDCNACLLLVQDYDQAKQYSRCVDSQIILVIENDLRQFTNSLYVSKPVVSSDLINVIYTSGTTGQPKGVEVNHDGIVNYILWRISEYEYDEHDVTLQLSPYNFDTYASNLYSALLSGGALLIIPEKNKLNAKYISEVIRHERVTNSCMTPGFYDVILDALEGDKSFLRFMVLAGEKAANALLGKSHVKFPDLVLYNEYGPTEASVAATYYKGLDRYTSAIIGKPIANTKVFILDKYNGIVPVGVSGELCIGGVGVARGYLNNKKLTDEKFVVNPKLNGERVYKTGDLAKWHRDGNIEFLGRIDSQVKIRGFRIELGEIENQLASYSDIEEAVVVAKTTKDDKFLAAYYVAGEKIDVPALRSFLAERIPLYMIPSYYVQLPSLPLLANGKIDRKALPDPELTTGADYLAPSNEVEEKLVLIWADVLKTSREVISVNQNFFDIGGHSLKATVMVNKIFKEFDVEFPLQKIFTINSVAKISEYIENEKWIRSRAHRTVSSGHEVILD